MFVASKGALNSESISNLIVKQIMSNNVILDNLDQPDLLEAAYRKAPDTFEADLERALAIKSDSETLRVWRARLHYSPPTETRKVSILTLVLLCLLTGFLVKIPSFLPVDDNWFYPRFIPFVTISAITAYFLLSGCCKQITKYVIGALIICVLYLVVLPEANGSASITMAFIHLPLFTISLLAISFMSEQWQSVSSRMNFIRYLGEMIIYAVLILLGGMVLTGLTLGLFSLIELRIEEWYMEYIVVLGLVSSPVVATYLFDSIQNRQSKFAPVLANVFSPLFLITVLAYLIATVYQGKSPYTDRDFLITFNGLLLVILALTMFSVSGKKQRGGVVASDYINIGLISATLLVNVVALSAILFRWAEYGTSLNRVVVTGANILVFVHLGLLLLQYLGHLRTGQGVANLESTIAKYLPIYTAWSLFVSLVLPLVFQFK